MSFNASDPGVSVGSVSVGGVSVLADAGLGVGGSDAGVAAGPVGDVGVGDVLAFTGTGPGTLPLAILGAVSIIGGLFATLFARRRTDDEPQAPVNGLADLAPLAATAGPPARG
jgi:hypothetical protein